MKYNIWIECKAFFTKKKKQENRQKTNIYTQHTHKLYIMSMGMALQTVEKKYAKITK